MKNSFFRKCIIAMMSVLVIAGNIGCMKSGESTDDRADIPKIIVGSDIYEPYIYRNVEGEFEGIDVEIATEAFGRMGYEPEFKVIVWENKKDCLAAGEADCLWGCFSMNGRAEEYLWAGPYLYSRQMVAVRMESNIREIADLEGKIVAVQETSKAEDYFLHSTDENVPDIMRLYCFSSMDEVFAALRKNYAEAICGHESALRYFIGTAPEEYRLLDESLLISSLGVAFDKEYDSEFVSELGKVLEDMTNDGTMARIVEKYGLNVDKALGREER